MKEDNHIYIFKLYKGHSFSEIDNFFISIYRISVLIFNIHDRFDLLLSCNGIFDSTKRFVVTQWIKSKEKRNARRMLVSHDRLSIFITLIDKHDDCDSCTNFKDRATLTPNKYLWGSPILLRNHWLYFRAGKDEIIANI